MPKGYLALVLHAHLPYVRHPELTDSFEERWFYEAVTETYLPLLEVFDRLVADGVHFRLTVSFSPPLMEMLRDPLLLDRYEKHLGRLLELADREIARTRGDEQFSILALYYRRQLDSSLHRFVDILQRDILGGFIALERSGHLELITTAATHAYLPLFESYEPAVRAQIDVACDTFEKQIGHRPAGFWLPECGYYPGLDRLLAAAGVRYFFVESHGLLYGRPRPRYGTYAPVSSPSGVAAFARDISASKQVWSSKEGYPGDYDYREYYRDIGFDLPLDYVGPYVHESGQRLGTGFKYYRITGPEDHKEPYVPEWATEKAAIHAGNFLFNRQRQAEHLHGLYGRPPIVVAPYDAELFGHWWFEGPQWLNFLLRKMHFDQEDVALSTPAAILEEFGERQAVEPNLSSWGFQGYNEFWLNPRNDWIYRHLHRACERMIYLVSRHPAPTPLERRALNQAARELLLSMASDWAFIMKTGTHAEYAVQRTTEHVLNFQALDAALAVGSIQEKRLAELETNHSVFPTLDYRTFASAVASRQER